MNDHPAPHPAIRLDDLGTIIVTGADARSFLQGQLSFDLTRLTNARVELASVNSPQGRVQAVTWLVERTDAIILLLPIERVDTIVARLRKFVMRARVGIESGIGQLDVGGVTHDTAPGPLRSHSQANGHSRIGWPGAVARSLIIAPTADPLPVDSLRAAQWRREDIGAGLPQVYTATHETFVAQMLNLDLLQGISFDKGCYTGQEIIARMHFRGQVKRRMLRFAFAGAPPLPGTRVIASGSHAGDVVAAVATATGSELLAVINLAQQHASLTIDGQTDKVLTPLALPYEVG